MQNKTVFKPGTWDYFNAQAECNPFSGLFLEKDINNLEQSLDQGYEIRIVPDEERRVISRREVNDCQECLKNQKEVIKERPEAYKFLIIVNSIILVIGLLLLKFW